MLGRMGKLFGKPPSDYFNTDNQYVNVAINMACACAHWEDENHNYKKSQETAKEEAGSIADVLAKTREEMEGRS